MSQASTMLVSSQVANQPANTVTQPQAAQVVMLTPEQLYQQQLQYPQLYQQYYPQYPGFYPYQQNYQYYYQYPQVAQQYQQQQPQGYLLAYVQPQTQGNVQAQTQPIVEAQTQPIVQAQQQVRPQVPSPGAHPPLQPQAQTAVNAQLLVPSAGQTQSQIQAQGQVQPQMQAYGQAQPQTQGYGSTQPQTQAQGQAPMPHALSYNQAQARPLPQAQPYTQPQPVSQQQLQVPQYPHTHPQMQHPHTQPYPQSQTQHYQHPEQVHSSQPNLQLSAHPPQRTLSNSAQFQTPNTVSGYQSYPQQLQSPVQIGAVPATEIAGAQQLAHYPNQMHGQFPLQAAQMYPPQSYSNVLNQQQPAILPAQGQPSSRPTAQQLPMYPQDQQPGYPFQQPPSVQAAQVAPQQYGDQQSFRAQGSVMQHRPSKTGQLRAQRPSHMPLQSQQSNGQHPNAQNNVAHNHGGRPMRAQEVVYPYAQAPAHAGGSQVRPPQSNQNHPMKASNQASSAEQQATQSQRVSSGEKSRDPMMEKSVHDEMDTSKEAVDKGMKSSEGSREGELKLKTKNGLTVGADENDGENRLRSKQMPNVEAKLDNQVQEVNPREKADTRDKVSKPSGDADKSGVEDPMDGFKKAKVQGVMQMAKHVSESSTLPASCKSPTVDHDKNQPQPMPYGRHKRGASSMPQAINHPVNSHQHALLGHPSNQLGPQGPGQASVSTIPLASAIPLEKPYGGKLGPGSAGSMSRPANVNHHQGGLPPHQAGQPQNPSVDHWPGASRYEIAKSEAQFDETFGHVDGRQSDSHPLGPIERSSFVPGLHDIQPGDKKFGGPSALDSMPPMVRDDMAMKFAEEQLKRSPHREFEDDSRRFSRPSHLEVSPSNYETQFSSPRPLDGNGMPRSFDRDPHGFDRDRAVKMDVIGSSPSRLLPPLHHKDFGERAHAFSNDDMGRADLRRPDFSGPSVGPGFGRQRIDGWPTGSPGSDYSGFPSKTVGPYGDVCGNQSQPSEGSESYNFLAAPFGKPTHGRGFRVSSRGDFDGPGNLHQGEHLTPHQDLMPNPLQRGGDISLRSSQPKEVTAFGRHGGPSRIEPPLGNFPPHVPFHDSFGGEKQGDPLQGETGFRGGYDVPLAHDGGFYPREMDPFNNLRMQGEPGFRSGYDIPLAHDGGFHPKGWTCIHSQESTSGLPEMRS
ncbi:hypothetical protein RND81_05G262900 [Saponaria officinalis]|uniref:Uncharacterized protein n=1 Tax=Saponaria officinalis TaxID=3572 RepID=A0AAW1L1Z4_SAPOF